MLVAPLAAGLAYMCPVLFDRVNDGGVVAVEKLSDLRKAQVRPAPIYFDHGQLAQFHHRPVARWSENNVEG